MFLSNGGLESGFLMAIGVLVAIFILPMFVSDLRRTKSILFGYWFVIVLHQVVAFTNLYFFYTPGAVGDSNGYHTMARELVARRDWSGPAGGYHFYTHLLGVVYEWFGTSHLLGEQLSILMFAFSCIVFLKIMEQLDLKHYQLSSLIVFGALPTMVFLGSITLKESYQVLFFMLAVFYGIKMHMKGGINTYFILMLLSALLMGLFHPGLILYAAFLIILFVLWMVFQSIASYENKGKLVGIALMLISMVLLSLVVLLNMDFDNLAPIAKLIDKGVLEAIAERRGDRIISSGRTTYGIPLDNSSAVMSVYSIAMMYVHYQFGPFPWQVENGMDAYAAGEAILRTVLIWFSVKCWLNADGKQKQLLGLMLILYFSSTFMWSVTTTNYGTALRHQMVSWWIIVITGVSPLMPVLIRLRSRLMQVHT